MLGEAGPGDLHLMGLAVRQEDPAGFVHEGPFGLVGTHVDPEKTVQGLAPLLFPVQQGAQQAAAQGRAHVAAQGLAEAAEILA